MTRPVVITGLGPISGLGIGIDPTWAAVTAGTSAVAPLAAFDASAFACKIAAEVKDLKINDFVPKSYRKAVKVMARDIQLAVAAADLAARDAKLVTKGTAPAPDARLSYDPPRVGCHIGAGLIAAELDELTGALTEARDPATGQFDIQRWGNHGMGQLTPLWLLKYLPNMLACHVTITHDTQGPSNTITCAEASSGLSIGESLRVIQRGAADTCFCGGTESKVNPMAFLRQIMTGRLTTEYAEPAKAVRPLCQTAAGAAVGEGGAIVILEALETFQKRSQVNGTARAYAQVAGFGASQTVNPATRNQRPDAEGRSIALAIRAALREAGVTASDIDLIVPFGLAVPEWDQAEAAALRSVFGEALPRIPLCPIKSMTGNCGAGAGGLDVCVAAKALYEQTLPAVINCDKPLPGLQAGAAPSRQTTLRHALTYSAGFGGQNAALVLKRL